MKLADDARLHCRTGRGCDNPPTDCLCRCLDCTEANLLEIANWFEELREDRFPGTRRRWHQRRDTLEEAADRAILDRSERTFRFGANSNLPDHLRPRITTPPGASPSPARDDVLDKIAEVTWAVIEIRELVAVALNAGRRRLPVPEACRWIASALPAVDRGIALKVADEARGIVRTVRAGTGQTEDVIQLDAPCIICGQETLLAYAARMSVTCVSDECVCDLHDCPCQQGHRHTWVEDQLVWLARVLGAEDVEAS